METTVTEEIVLLTREDKQKITRNAVIALVFVTALEVFAGFFLFYFFDSDDFKIIRWVFYGFFVLVGLFIIYINITNYFEKYKRVSVGYIADKRVHNTYSKYRSSTSSSGQTTYYITLGDKERSIEQYYFNQVQKGDKVRVHETKSNKSIFKVDILERGIPAFGTFTAEGNRPLSVLPPDSDEPADKGEISLIRGKFVSLLFYRGLLMGSVCIICYFVFTAAILFAVPKEWWDTLRWLMLAVPVLLAAIIFIWVNKKTFSVVKDLMEGRRKVSVKRVQDVIKSNKLKTSKNATIVSSTTGEYYYVETQDGYFLNVNAELGKKLQAGDTITLHTSPNAGVLLKVK